MNRTHAPGRGPWLLALALLAWWGTAVGCRPSLEQSPSAEPLPAVDYRSVSLAGEANADGNQSAAAVWSGWRGGPRGGVADDASLPLEWSTSNGWRWKVPLPGAGNSSPVVWGESIYLTTAVGEDPATAAVLCLARSDGSLRWRADVARLSDPTHVKNGHASASVATDGERVYAFFGSGGLFCFDTEGRQLWHAELGELNHVWGTASSPVLCGELVLQLCDHERDSFLVALDRRSGETIWKTPRESYGCWTTPVIVQAEGDDGSVRQEIVVNGTGTSEAGGGWVIAYDSRDGHELWRAQGTTDIVTPTAIVHAGLVISTSGRNGPTLAIRPGGRGDVTQSRVVWKLRRGGAYVPTGVGYGNRLYTISDGGVAAAYNIGNGELIWRSRLKGSFTSSLIAGAGRIYATNERGTTYVWAARDEFELLATNELGERCLATPAVAAGEIFLRTDRHLYCISSPPPSETVAEQSAGADGAAADPAATAESSPAEATAEAAPSDARGPRSAADPGVEPASFQTPRNVE